MPKNVQEVPRYSDLLYFYVALLGDVGEGGIDVAAPVDTQPGQQRG